ncbi:transketolase [Synergistaceae bacterium OttesenSCG-928-I11]|nr:transketolase [Synergistaceae bacterium OttesenSCG-928-I11]
MKSSQTPAELRTLRNFAADAPDEKQIETLKRMARDARLDAVLMTGIAGSGHPAGALSSMDIFNTLFAVADLTPANCCDAAHDRIVVSHGHTSAGVYASLAAWGFVDRDAARANFRRAGSPFQGHVERMVPGVDWGTGNLGQGLAAGVGFALADRACGRTGARVYVVMGDGEQPKGQNAEARRIAVKENLSHITALIDANDIQIGGKIDDVMPANIPLLWAADGWNVIECDGHDYQALYDALKRADVSDLPTVVICRTVMGKGVSFMEGIAEYHGKTASGDLLVKAIQELGGDPAEVERLKKIRTGDLPKGRAVPCEKPSLDLGTPRTYTDADKKDGRGAFGTALADVAKENISVPGRTPILAFDCDLLGSVKLDLFAKVAPDHLVETGIQEHATATVAGAASTAGVVAVWADFGVFGIDEVYNQQRLNDVNHAPIKTVLTHVGLDVGEDGMTHQCIDYVGAFRNFFGYKLVVPADPNQADRATRWMLGEPCAVCLAVGRGVHPVILKEDGTPLFGGDYQYEYGKIDILRDGKDATILAMGHMAVSAIAAADALKAKGVSAQVLHCSAPLGIDAGELVRLVSGKPLVTAEDHHADTGLGAIAALHLARAGVAVKMRNLGVTRYGDSGKASEVVARMGLTPADIATAVESLR